MRKTLCALVLALSAGCSAMPVDKKIEAKPAKKSLQIFGRQTCTIRVLFNQLYATVPQEQKEKDRQILIKILQYQAEKDKSKFTDREKEFLPFFGLLRRFTKSDDFPELDIISETGLDYPVLRLGNWTGIYYKPKIIIKPAGVSLGTLTHEFCHATDKHYSKIKYILSKAHRCRMESVAMAGEQHVSDYISCVYGMHELSEYLWDRSSIDATRLQLIKEKNKTFEAVYENEAEGDISKIMIHILADKFKGNLEKTYFFLRENDCENVFETIYSHLKKNNYSLAVQNAIKSQSMRLLWRQR